jgi:hypothetical protein
VDYAIIGAGPTPEYKGQPRYSDGVFCIWFSSPCGEQPSLCDAIFPLASLVRVHRDVEN